MKIRTAMPTGVDLNLLAAGYEEMALAKGAHDSVELDYGLPEAEYAPTTLSSFSQGEADSPFRWYCS